MEINNNESFIAYIRRITNACSNKQLTYTEWGDYLLGEENVYTEDNCRKGYYIVKKLLCKIDESVEITDDELMKQLESIKDEIYKERVKLQDVQREKRKILRVDARFENLLDVLKKEIEKLTPIELKVCSRKADTNIEASLMISDLHIGLVVDNAINYYDIEIAKERLGDLCSKTIKYCKLHNVNKLNVECLGDAINGIIQIGNRIDEEEDAISQIITVSELLSNFINNLKSEIPQVIVYGVIGNHSSVFANKKERSNKENFERLIFEYIKLRIGQKVITNGLEDYLTYKIKDKTVVLTHGNRDNLQNAKQHFVDLLGIIPDYIHFGHIHHFNIKDDCDTEITTNGSLISTDDFATSIRKNTKASQALIIYGEDVCTYKIVLN